MKIKEHFIIFMGKIFENDQAEPPSPLKEDKKCWHLPTFGVCYRQKPGQIWAVFDSSAQQSGVSLNNMLLTGPDLNNSLLRVLIQFQKNRLH